MPTPLSEQIAAIETAIFGSMPTMEELEAVLATLQWLQRNETTVKSAIARAAALREAVKNDPVVQQIQQAFPGAELVDE